MTVQAFMTSGILEKYALGMASDEEKNEVLEMASQHIEIKEELSAIRQTLKGYVLSHQVSPPDNLKEKIMSVGDRKVASPTRKEAASTSTYQPTSSKRKDGQGMSMANIAVALLGLVLIAACFTAFSFFNDAKKAETELATAKEEMEGIKKLLSTEQATNKELLSQIGFYQDRDNQTVVLKGTSRSPNAKATIFWNETTRSASIDLPALPSLASDKVAVLWVNAKGGAQKLGVLKTNEPGVLTEITYISSPDLFFVTEEDNPDVDRPNRARILMTGS